MLGAWSRIEGYPSDLNPNDPVAKITSESLFNLDGRLNPSITILGEFNRETHNGQGALLDSTNKGVHLYVA